MGNSAGGGGNVSATWMYFLSGVVLATSVSLMVQSSKLQLMYGELIHLIQQNLYAKKELNDEKEDRTIEIEEVRNEVPAANPLQEKKVLPIRILYASETGTSKGLAESLRKQIFALNVSGFHFETSILSLNDYDQDNLELESMAIFVVSTWSGGAPPSSGKIFFQWLEDMALDFRVSRSWLSNLNYAVFGLGTSEYDELFCAAAKTLESKLDSLGAQSMIARGSGDDAADISKQFQEWSNHLVSALCEYYSSPMSEKKDVPLKKKHLSLKEFRREKKQQEITSEKTEEDLLNERMLIEESDDEQPEPEKPTASSDNDVDVEDLGHMMQQSELSNASREMITPMQRKALTKEGYKIIGTHSAVKLCRWTKHQLRGRGGCYKHTFYGITSYQCMETTPSLACANKCVFCWRHHKNPVGREWRWKVDEPVELVVGAIERHQKMIKELKGLPGLRMDRWEEAFTVKHCALSLVGEPIMYPYINEFLDELHERNISSFLVTNAQFPDKIASLNPVTQLYVSIDAATKESLRAVDRPLFKDFWERFLMCLKALRDKKQRTVYRLTLVKSYNMEEVDEYCSLIRIGQPDLIEIKAVTYCGKSDGSSLTMQNVPWHEEVKTFSSDICNKMDGMYDLVAEHAHSNSVLLAKKSFFINGKWHTWINYEKFNELVLEFKKTGKPFTALDYVAPTPEWALYDSEEAGFDPEEVRFRRSKEGKQIEIKYKPSGSGCG